MSNLELRIEEEANLGLTISESSDMSFDAVDFVGVPFAPTVEVEDIEGGHRVSITSMGAEGKKTDEFDVMDGADGATGPQGPKGDSYEITAADYAEIAKVVEEDIQDVIDAAQDAADDATAAAAEARAASAATWLSGNVLFGELSEGTVLTADDVYTAPPQEVDVFGVSTQVTTTGKNLWDDARYASVGWTKSSDSLYHGYIKSFCDGILDLGNGDYPESTQVTICLNIVRTGISGTIRLRFDYTDGTSSETSNISSSKLHYTYTSTAGKTVSAARIMTSAGSSNDNFRFSYIQVGVGVDPSAYEPYSGGRPSPSPDYPQPISSVDDLAILLMGKNILDPSTIEQGTLISGHNFASDSRCRTDAKIPVVAGSSIVMSGTSSGGTLEYFAASYKSGIFETNGVGWVAMGQAITVPSGVDECRFAFRNSDESAIVPSDLTNIQLEIGTTATAYEPYVGQSISIPLSNNKGRSLPDGTRDTLTLSYVGPSTEHDGWGVYERVLEMATGEVDLGDLEWSETRGAATTEVAFKWRATIADISTTKEGNGSKLCTNYICKGNTTISANIPNGEIFSQHGSHAILVRDDAYVNASVQDWTEHVTGATFQYILATPVTVTLDPIELPILPNPLTAWADGGSAQTTMQLEYERALSIVIPRIEAAISDLATS